MIEVLLLLLGSAMAAPVVDVAQSLEHLPNWESWKEEHGKNYTVDEEARMAVFKSNVELIREHNKRFLEGKVSFSLKINEFADMTAEEYAARNGFRVQSTTTGQRPSAMPSAQNLPRQVDWREKGYVTPVKNQGHCGSCWAFSTTGSLEGQWMKATGELVSLSEQQLVDCSRAYGNLGCRGGLMDQAFRYIQVDGLESEKDYAYTATDGECKHNATKDVVVPKGRNGLSLARFVDIPQGDEAALKAAVASVGPVSVAIDASHFSFQFYHEGIYVEPYCSSEKLDHGVLVVGYGVEKSSNGNYWLVKNSWGPKWGNEGYIMMARDKSNMCGIATAASYPLLKSG